MLHSALFYLLCREAVVLGILLQRLKISSVCSVLGCFLSCHSSAVTVNHDTVLCHYWHLVYCLSVVVLCYHVRHSLSVLVVLIVTVVDGASFLVYGETLALLISIVGVMRRSKAVSLHQFIVPLNLATVWQSACALVAHNARAAFKLLSRLAEAHVSLRRFCFCLHRSLHLLLHHRLLDVGVKLKLLLGSFNSSLLLGLSLQHVRIVSGHVYIHLLGFAQILLGSLNLAVCHSLSILSECLFYPLGSMLWSHHRVVSSLATLRILCHGHR